HADRCHPLFEKERRLSRNIVAVQGSGDRRRTAAMVSSRRTVCVATSAWATIQGGEEPNRDARCGTLPSAWFAELVACLGARGTSQGRALGSRRGLHKSQLNLLQILSARQIFEVFQAKQFQEFRGRGVADFLLVCFTALERYEAEPHELSQLATRF